MTQGLGARIIATKTYRNHSCIPVAAGATAASVRGGSLRARGQSRVPGRSVVSVSRAPGLAPVYRSRLNAWSHREATPGVGEVLRHPAAGVEESKSSSAWPPWRRARSHGFSTARYLFRDPPDRDHPVRLAARAFTPRRIEELRPRVEALTCRRLDTIASRGEMDLLADLAYPLTVDVICELLGIPTRIRGAFQLGPARLAARLDVCRPFAPGIEQRGAAAAASCDLHRRRRHRPRKRVPGGLIGAFVSAERTRRTAGHLDVRSCSSPVTRQPRT